ncbi:MAG: YlxR family protein [Eubacterium sp.]|nr:YlxR family protein [Eubacterium sp.]
MRTCIGCRESKAKNEMIRVCCYEGRLSVDLTGRAKGRGVYVCRDPECLAKLMKKKALARGFHMGFDDEALKNVYDELDKIISGEEGPQDSEDAAEDIHARRIMR